MVTEDSLVSVIARPCVLVVDDDRQSLRAVSRNLRQMGFEVVEAADAEEAWEHFQSHDVDVCLLDQYLPDGSSGVELMVRVHEADASVRCIIFTGDGDPSVAFDALSHGAAEYFEKPIANWGELQKQIQQGATARHGDKAQDDGNNPSVGPASMHDVLQGRSSAIRDVRWRIERLAPRGVTVLLLGETGVGKTLVAEFIHNLSGRSGPLEIINCGSLNRETMVSELFGHEEGAFTGAHKRHHGAFERTAGGTLVLDEIGELPEEAQRKLLHALDGGYFTRMGGSERLQTRCRVVAATNRDLDAAVEQGTFRADLLNRLGLQVRVPPLNERREDIPRLVYMLLDQANRRHGTQIRSVDRAVIGHLQSLDWTGLNLRGMKNLLDEMCVYASGDHLTEDLLPERVRRKTAPVHTPAIDGLEELSSEMPRHLPPLLQAMSYREFKDAVLDHFVPLYLKHRLRETGGNVTQSASMAEMHRPNFKRAMNRYGISIDDLHDD